jgi:membrane-bound ClpP family serine protease
MWAVAGILIGLMVLGLLVGMHTGPHTHAVASIFGVAAAVWLVIMATQGHTLSLVIVLLVAVVLVTAGIIALAWKGLAAQSELGDPSKASSLEGSQGKALTDLSPEGIVRVRGEDWSARSLNGIVHAGEAIQVINAVGVRLEVWGEEAGLSSPKGITEHHHEGGGGA